MPRKPVLEFHDQFISFCMTAKIDQVTSLLQIGTQIVKVRARTPSDVALPFPSAVQTGQAAPRRGRRPKVSTTLDVTPSSAPSPRPATPADAADLAAARERANQAIGAGPRDTRPRRPRVAPAPATTTTAPVPDAGDPVPDLDTE